MHYSEGKAAGITREILEENFGLPLVRSAKKLGLSVTYFKKVCRDNGVLRWPYRQVIAKCELRLGLMRKRKQLAAELSCDIVSDSVVRKNRRLAAMAELSSDNVPAAFQAGRSNSISRKGEQLAAIEEREQLVAPTKDLDDFLAEAQLAPAENRQLVAVAGLSCNNVASSIVRKREQLVAHDFWQDDFLAEAQLAPAENRQLAAVAGLSCNNVANSIVRKREQRVAHDFWQDDFLAEAQLAPAENRQLAAVAELSCNNVANSLIRKREQLVAHNFWQKQRYVDDFLAEKQLDDFLAEMQPTPDAQARAPKLLPPTFRNGAAAKVPTAVDDSVLSSPVTQEHSVRSECLPEGSTTRNVTENPALRVAEQEAVATILAARSCTTDQINGLEDGTSLPSSPSRSHFQVGMCAL